MVCPQCKIGKLSLVLLNLEGECAFACMGSKLPAADLQLYGHSPSQRQIQDVSTSSSQCCDWHRRPRLSTERLTIQSISAREAEAPFYQSQIAACTPIIDTVKDADQGCFREASLPSLSNHLVFRSHQLNLIQAPSCLFPFHVLDPSKFGSHLEINDFLCTKFECPHQKAASLLEKLNRLNHLEKN